MSDNTNSLDSILYFVERNWRGISNNSVFQGMPYRDGLMNFVS